MNQAAEQKRFPHYALSFLINFLQTISIYFYGNSIIIIIIIIIIIALRLLSQHVIIKKWHYHHHHHHNLYAGYVELYT